MSFVKRVTNLGRGLWKTRGSWSGEHEDALDVELAHMAQEGPDTSAPHRETPRRARSATPVEQLAALERALRDGELDEDEFRQRHDRIMSRAVGDEDTQPRSASPGKKTL